jgi:hypothetical protein
VLMVPCKREIDIVERGCSIRNKERIKGKRGSFRSLDRVKLGNISPEPILLP